jgi:hypothetical protein
MQLSKALSLSRTKGKQATLIQRSTELDAMGRDEEEDISQNNMLIPRGQWEILEVGELIPIV